MIEYIYNAIRARAGEDIGITAKLSNDEEPITENCKLTLLTADNEVIIQVAGEYSTTADIWLFTIPAEVTTNLNGRYWYCIKQGDSSLCFKEPIYLV